MPMGPGSPQTWKVTGKSKSICFALKSTYTGVLKQPVTPLETFGYLYIRRWQKFHCWNGFNQCLGSMLISCTEINFYSRYLFSTPNPQAQGLLVEVSSWKSILASVMANQQTAGVSSLFGLWHMCKKAWKVQCFHSCNHRITYIEMDHQGHSIPTTKMTTKSHH